MTFRNVPNKVDFVALEREILAFWRETGAFEKLQELRAKSDKRWSFIDGPITANNPMGVHHAWGRTYKDLYQRFKAMQGYDQRWQNGFDCQGLWVEVNVEKELGFNSKREIEELTALVHAHRLVVLYGDSGVGKTSLLQAGVIPRLTQAEPGYAVVLVRAYADPAAAIRADIV